MRVFESGISGGEIFLNSENSHHVWVVMRKGVGDGLTVCDGKGLDYHCTITQGSKNQVACRVDRCEESRGELPVSITLYAALSKGERFEVMIQKCVELGVYKIVPFESQNCVVQLKGEKGDKKAARYNKIALEAAKQSGRGIVPQVLEPVSFKKACEMAAGQELPLFLYECEVEHSLKANLAAGGEVKTIAIMTGPEGGFTPNEAEQAGKCGLNHTTLGGRILRCETAPMAAIAGISAILEK